MSVHEISQDTIASMKVEGTYKREPRGVDLMMMTTQLQRPQTPMMNLLLQHAVAGQYVCPRGMMDLK